MSDIEVTTGCKINVKLEYTVEPISCEDKISNVKFTAKVPQCKNNDWKLCDCPTSIELSGTTSKTGSNDNFRINTPSNLSIGLVVTNGNSFIWTIPAPLGSSAKETIHTLTLAVEYIGSVTAGTELDIFNPFNLVVVNANKTQPEKKPSLTVPSCPVEECITPVPDDSLIETDFTEDCDDAAEIDFIEKPYEMSLGRTVVVRNIKVKNVCPDKDLAVGVILFETDKYGNFIAVRGSKYFLIPAQDGKTCSHVCLDCLYFVVPEKYPTLCTTRYFSAKLIAHHAESDLDLAECEDEEPEA